MAWQYGIGVTRNRFELSDSDDDPLEVLKRHEVLKEQRKKKATGKENSAAFKNPASKQVVSREGKPEVGPRNKNTGSGYVARNTRDEFFDSKFNKPVLRDGNGRSIHVTNRGARAGFESRGKREFERHSGSEKTGVKCVEKKDGAGAFNWDSFKDTVKQAEEKGNFESNEKAEDPTEPEQAVERDEETVAVENDNACEMTLDEWKALRVPKSTRPVHNLRKAGEGEDLSRWKKMYVLENKHFEEREEEEEYEHCDYPQRVGRQKHLLDIDIRFKEVSTRAGRDRATGRGPRNTSPKDPEDSPATKKEVPRTDNEHEFPSLA